MVATPTRRTSQTSNKTEPETRAASGPEITWEKLPENFLLPDDPVDNINQPALAAALTESLNLAGYLSETAVTTTNYGICATLNNRTVVKAPDWAWIQAISVPKTDIERSYTPVLEGDTPIVVMEFLSETEGEEYSIKRSYPPGKWFYYERILKVPNYVILNLKSGLIEFYRLSDEDIYEPQQSNEQGQYWLPEANLFLGLWDGTHQKRSGYWLRWWTPEGKMLLWGEELAEQQSEQLDQERQRAEMEQQRAQEERQRADSAEMTKNKAIQKLVDMGLSPEQVADTLDISVETVRAAMQG